MVSTSVVRMKIPNDILCIISDFAVFSNEEKFIRERFYLIIHGDLTNEDFGEEGTMVPAYHNHVLLCLQADLKDYDSGMYALNLYVDKAHKVHSKDHRYITEIEVIRIFGQTKYCRTKLTVNLTNTMTPLHI